MSVSCVSGADGANPAAPHASGDGSAAPARPAPLVGAASRLPLSPAPRSAPNSTSKGPEDPPNARIEHARPSADDLRNALAGNGFTLAYQPIVSAATGAITGCEALLRWHRPTGGPVSPADFVPLAERAGLIVPIGAWVLDQACREAATWPESCRVSVNVSPTQLLDPGLPEQVAAVLAARGLPARRLELEVTEAVLIDDARTTLRSIAAVRALGVSVALDDFGTGYSSLGYLQRFPFDRLKIDRSFVRHLGERAESQILIRAMCDIARGLGMAVTAEGVETASEAEILRSIDCDELQGFLFGRPIEPAAAGLLLADASQAPGPASPHGARPRHPRHRARRHAPAASRLPLEDASDHA